MKSSRVFTAVAAPRDRQGRTLALKDWTLADYIGVAHEVRWISQSVRDVSHLLRDYRNYIHPQKELAQQLALTMADASVLWSAFRAIAVQLL